MKILTFFLIFLAGLPALASPKLKVASLHPLLSDWIKQIGGDHVDLVEIGRPGMKVHDFSPNTADLKALGQARVIFASGKGLETYLDDLSDALESHQAIVDLGKSIPSLKVDASEDIYTCCPDHAVGDVDPHWWHNPRHALRAARQIQETLVSLDPENEKSYRANFRETNKRLRTLDRWVKTQVGKIPEKQRHLVSAHAAFGYFCKAYGFQATYVQGLAATAEVPAKQLADQIRKLRQTNIRAVFPERFANPKVLQQIARETGATLAPPLTADGSVASYHDFIRNNVTTIVNALTASTAAK